MLAALLGLPRGLAATRVGEARAYRDERTSRTLERFRELVDDRAFFDMSGNQPATINTANQLVAYRLEDPELAARTRRILFLPDYFAFRLSGVWLCGITATPETNLVEIHKTALGAEESVEWHHADDTLEAVRILREEGYTIVAIEQCHGSVMLNKWTAWPEGSRNRRFAFIMGNEVQGVDQRVVDAADMVIEIPQYGTKHSLNVSVTAGVVMWEVLRQALSQGLL